jgi:molybdopterin molybdotransferase
MARPVWEAVGVPEFFTVLSPEAALAKLWAHLPAPSTREFVPTAEALGRVTAEAVRAPAAVPAFERSTMDGYAVRAQDTFGASPSLPAYLTVIGEAPMGRAPGFSLGPAQAALVHTGGMLPEGADAVVMIELTQKASAAEIEVLKAAAPGENVLRVGDDIASGAEVVPAGHWLRPQDLGGLMALGLTGVAVARRPRVALLGTGDEVVAPEAEPAPGQVRDVNSYSVAGQVVEAGGVPLRRGIVPDDFDALAAATAAALAEADALVVSAGSSVSVRDMTGDAISRLGPPGVLVHGVAVKPGKPTILAVANGKPIFGLPGNPVSAMVIADLFLVPTLYRVQGCAQPPRRQAVRARLAHNVASQAGRVDYVPARLAERPGPSGPEWWAEPVFGKSNQIFTLVQADGMLVVPMDSNGLATGDSVEVRLF